MNIATISPLNPLRFVPMEYDDNPKFNSPNFDRSWFKDYVRSWQPKTNYLQPVQQNDSLNIHIIGNKLPTNSIFRLFDCHGGFIKDIALDQLPIISTDFRANAISDFNFWADVPEGVYYGTLEVTFDNANLEKAFFITEPIHIKPKHEGTVLQQYSNSWNKDNVMFEQNNQLFEMRVHGEVMDYQALVDRYVFETQDYKTVPLSANAYRGWRFYIGGDGHPIPEYVIEKINHIFSCDKVMIDGTAYTAAEGASVDKQGDLTFPKYGAILDLRDAGSIEGGGSFTFGSITVIADLPAEYPFAVSDFGIGTLTGAISVSGQSQINFAYLNNFAYIVGQSSHMAGIAGYLNTHIQGFGLTGTFQLVGNSFIYNLGANETFDASFVRVMERGMQVGIEEDNAPQNRNTRTVANFLGQAGVRYVISPLVDIASNVYIDDYSVSNVNGVSPASGIIDHLYTTGISTNGEYKIWYFYEQRPFGLQITGSNVFKVQFKSELQTILQTFRVNDSNMLTGIDVFALLNSAKATITHIIVENCPNLETIDSFYFPAPSPSVLNSGWNSLVNINFSGNNLNDVKVDSLFNQMLQMANEFRLFQNFGIVSTAGQATAAPPTAASLFARTVLQTNYSYIIITD